MNHRKILYDSAIEIIASSLHYQDHVTQFNHGVTPITGEQTAHFIIEQQKYLREGWIERYRNDPSFNARVQSIVAGLMHGIEQSVEHWAADKFRRHLKQSVEHWPADKFRRHLKYLDEGK